MSFVPTLLLTIQILSGVAIIVLVLLQQGKGADMGSGFGSGSAGSLFGASGAANFLSRATKWVAIIFFTFTATLAWISHGTRSSENNDGVMQNVLTPSPISQDRSVPKTAPSAVNQGVPQLPHPSKH